MEELKIYNYHPITGEFTGGGFADKDQLVKDNWLIPAYATDIKPPESEENKALCFIDNKWQLVDDFRGKEYWLDDGSSHIIKELGKVMPSNALEEKPPEPPLTVEQINKARAVAYANPVTGSDRYFVEAARKRASGDEQGAIQAEQQGLALVDEIKNKYK